MFADRVVLRAQRRANVFRLCVTRRTPLRPLRAPWPCQIFSASAMETASAKISAASLFEILAHPFRIDFQSRDDFRHRVHRAACKRHDFRQRLPLGVPAAEAAFVLLRHRREHRADESGHARRSRKHCGATRPDSVCAASSKIRRGPFPAGSNTSATSVCDSSEMSFAIFPSVPTSNPRVVPISATRSRCECQGISRERQFQLLREMFRDFIGSFRSAPRAFRRRRRIAARGIASVFRASRSRWRSIASSQPATFAPKVVGTACCIHVRPTITVERCSVASSASAVRELVDVRARCKSTLRTTEE